MDRGRRGSVVGGDPRRKQKPGGGGGGGGFGQMLEPQQPGGASGKFGGNMVAPSLPQDDESLMIDPNLLVGPLYVPKTTRTDRIKEQLGDITQKLHNTLYAFDEFEDFEHDEDPLLGMMRKQIGDLDDTDMKDRLAHFMDQYEDMSMQVSEANRDRDDMLMQLADWFTTDHVDLEDIKSSIDETEEQDIKQSYFDTVTNFEKLKKLQNQIMKASSQGKPTRQLEMKKVELEKDVVDRFKVMKDMSMQTMKLKVSDDAPWKYAAQEIVSMLKNVRSENAEELQAIHKKMQEMIDQLEKQAMLIKALKVELKEKKEVCKKLTDENGDLSQDVALFRARYSRFERELDQAKKMIRSLHEEKQSWERDGVVERQDVTEGKTLAESISKVLSQLDEPEVKQFSSDPALLRTQIRDYQEALECIRSEYSRATEEVEELTTELQEKKEYINNMETENEKLTKDIRKMRQERRKSIAVGAIMPTPAEAQQCEIPDKDLDEEVEELKAEVKKWQDKCAYFKKCLADTEMKLSDAYKEISDLRMERDLPPPPPPPPPAEKPAEPPKEKPKAKPPKDTPVSAPAPKPEKPVEKKVEKEEPKSKPKREVKARYLQQSSRQNDRQKLPPIERQKVESRIEQHATEHSAQLTPKQHRELKLYKAGDLQGMLNMLVCEIMEFVSEIGKMLYKEKEDDSGKIQSMKAFTFEEKASQKKEVRDPKEEEAKMKKSQVIFNGQHACSKLREAFDCLSSSMELQHNEYEAIYRSFKISQQRNTIRREVIMGRLPVTALQDFDKKQYKQMREADPTTYLTSIHNEYEAIYRSFKISQQRNTIRREVIMGRLPVTALQDFDKKQYKQMREADPDNLLNVYFNISYGGGAGFGVVNKPRNANSLNRRSSSIYSLQSDSDDVEGKLKHTTLHGLGIKGSTSNLEVGASSPTRIGGIAATGLMNTRTDMFLPNMQDVGRFSRDPGEQPNRQEMKIGVAVVPNKGLISLQTKDAEIFHQTQQQNDLNIQGERRRSSVAPADAGAAKRSLIKRNDILEHIKLGNKLLEESEENKQQEDEISKSLGDYTILDLQSKLLEMTDAKSTRRQTPLAMTPDLSRQPKRPPPAMAQEKPVTLPAIKNLNPFKM